MKQLSSQPYWRRAKLAGFLLQLVPFVRLVGLNGSLSRGAANAQSDIDFLIICKPGRIWTCRVLSVVLMALLGLKRYQNKVAGRVCLNLYHTANHLHLSCHKKWLAQNYAYTLPFWHRGKIFAQFVRANQWIRKFGEQFHYQNYQPSWAEKVLSLIISGVRRVGEFVFELLLNDWGESRLKAWQTKRILADRRTLVAPKGAIYLSDQELRFHLPKNGREKS